MMTCKTKRLHFNKLFINHTSGFCRAHVYDGLCVHKTHQYHSKPIHCKSETYLYHLSLGLGWWTSRWQLFEQSARHVNETINYSPKTNQGNHKKNNNLNGNNNKCWIRRTHLPMYLLEWKRERNRWPTANVGLWMMAVWLIVYCGGKYVICDWFW